MVSIKIKAAAFERATEVKDDEKVTIASVFHVVRA